MGHIHTDDVMRMKKGIKCEPIGIKNTSIINQIKAWLMNFCPVFPGRLNVADGDLWPNHKLELSISIGWSRFKAHL